MFWLALGTTLLLWAAFSGAGRRLDAVTGLAVIALVALAVVAVRVYPPRTEAAALVGGSAIAVSTLWLVRFELPLWSRWAALLAGLATASFSVLGPAQGLFA